MYRHKPQEEALIIRVDLQTVSIMGEEEDRDILGEVVVQVVMRMMVVAAVALLLLPVV